MWYSISRRKIKGPIILESTANKYIYSDIIYQLLHLKTIRGCTGYYRKMVQLVIVEQNNNGNASAMFWRKNNFERNLIPSKVSRPNALWLFFVRVIKGKVVPKESKKSESVTEQHTKNHKWNIPHNALTSVYRLVQASKLELTYGLWTFWTSAVKNKTCFTSRRSKLLESFIYFTAKHFV